jgi:hypothetical protein
MAIASRLEVAFEFAFFNEFEGKKPPADWARTGQNQIRTDQVPEGFVRLL